MVDLEKTQSKGSNLPSVILETHQYDLTYGGSETNQNAVSRFIDSFKPMDIEEYVDTTGLNKVEISVLKSSMHPLARSLKGRHLQMIAIGGSIGTGLFVNAGYALATGGPASVLIAYALVGFSLFCVMCGLGELSVQFPVSGSFNAFFSRFIEPSWGFTLGILYSCSWLISFPSELVACSITIQYWNTSVDPAVWVAVFYVAIVSINFFGVRGFGEAEFIFSIIKVLAVVGFIILGICISCGVGKQGYIGGKYWHHPGAFNHGFKGVCSVFVSAAFSFGGVELVALAAAETKNPRKSLPKATKQVFWRITLFYILTAIIIGCIVPYNDDRLLTGSSSEDVTASPFVIAINSAGIKVLPDIMNVVVLISVVSVGNSSVYGCSRSLASLAAQGLLPEFVGYIDRAGRPLVAIMIVNIIGLLGFLVDANNQDTVFTWMFSVCSLSSFFTWASICFTHIRWRWALKAQNRSLDEVAFISPIGIWGSFAGAVILILLIAGEIWVSLFPIGEAHADVVYFWQDCLSLPLMLVLWAGFKFYDKSWGTFMIKLEDIDLDTGRRDIDLDQLRIDLAEERAALRRQPFYYRIYNFWC